MSVVDVERNETKKPHLTNLISLNKPSDGLLEIPINPYPLTTADM
jgi:hypothetical protein